MTQNPRASANDITSAATTEHKLMSGKTVLIRKIPFSVICEITENLPDVATLGSQKAAEVAVEKIDPKRRIVMIEKVIVAGVEDPKFTLDGAGGSPRPSDLNKADMLKLFEAVMRISQFNEEAKEEILPLSGQPVA